MSLILSDKATQSFGDFGNFGDFGQSARGASLPSGTFLDIKDVNMVKDGAQAEAYIVAPVEKMLGCGDDQNAGEADYTLYGIYHVDEHALNAYKKAGQADKKSGADFSCTKTYNALARSESGQTIFNNPLQAKEKARGLNREEEDRYIRDQAACKLSGVARWETQAQKLQGHDKTMHQGGEFFHIPFAHNS